MATNRLLALAERVVDDSDVDWALASSTVAPAEQEAVRQLRLVATISQTARKLAAMWGPFEIRQQVDHGTFGTVYRAWDRRVGREVALKLLHEVPAASTTEADVIHEARLLSAVDHPNIVPVFGADVHDGRVGIWMKFIAGRTLSDILAERGRFSAEEAAVIGRDLCQALAAVHAQGLVHRDVKAQNVMREDGGRIVLMDFGAGDSAEAARADVITGSPAYLAPEVVGGAAATARSDIYSLGVLLYHLVTAQFPITAGSWDELKSRHATGQRRRLRDARPDLPTWFVSIVDQALAQNPADRPATAGIVESGLSEQVVPRPLQWPVKLGIVGAVAAAIAIAAAAVSDLTRGGSTNDFAPILQQGLAVRTVSAAPGDDLLLARSNELFTGVIHRLRSELGIRVPEDQTLNRLQHLPDDAFARATSTGGVLTLSVDSPPASSSSPGQIAVGVRLSLASAGWGAVFEESQRGGIDDVAALTLRMTERIGSTLGLQATRLAQRPGTIPRGYSLGRFFAAKLTEADLKRAVENYNDAIRNQPEFAPAYAGLSEAVVLLHGNHRVYTTTEALTLASDSARRAIALDPGLAGGHTALAWASFYLGWDWPAAEAAFQQAIKADPADGVTRHLYADYLSAMRRPKEALEQEQRAIATDPASVRFNRGIGWIHFFAGDFAAAAAALEYTLSLDAGYVHARTLLARAYGQLGRHADALTEVQRVIAEDPGVGHQEILAQLHALAGRRAEAERIVTTLESSSSASAVYVRPYFLALVWAALGERDRALGALERAFREHDSTLVNMGVDPRLRDLRGDARYVALCGRLKLC